MGREVGKSPASPPSPPPDTPTSEPGRGWFRGACGQAEGTLQRGLNLSSSSPSHAFWDSRITREGHRPPKPQGPLCMHGVFCTHKPPAWLGPWPLSRRGSRGVPMRPPSPEGWRKEGLPMMLKERKPVPRRNPPLGRGGSTTPLQGGGSRGRELNQRLWLTAAHPAPWGFGPAFLTLGANVAQPRPG